MRNVISTDLDPPQRAPLRTRELVALAERVL